MKKTLSALVALLGPLFLIIVLAHISYTIEGYTSVSFNPYPRMIWYLALICLLFMNYSMQMVLFSVAILFLGYFVVGFFYFFSTVVFLKPFKELQKYYRKQWYVVFLLPFFNLLVFFIRFAGIINSINTSSAWKTRNFTEEKQAFKDEFLGNTSGIRGAIQKFRAFVNVPGMEDE